MTMVVDFCSALLPTASKDTTAEAGVPQQRHRLTCEQLVTQHPKQRWFGHTGLQSVWTLVENHVANRAKSGGDLVGRFIVMQPTRQNKLCVRGHPVAELALS